MVNDKSKLTEGNLWKQIFTFSLPLILSNLLQAAFNVSDLMVIGKFAGANSLGAVGGSTSMLVMLFTGFLIGLGSGINSLVALNFGAKNDKGVNECVHTSFVLALIVGTVLAIIGITLARPILLLLNTKPELIDGAVLYFSVFMIGMPALAVYNFGNGVFSAVGDTKKPLIFLAVSGAINVILNLVFVIVFQLDVLGVALATIISIYIAAVLVIISLSRSKESIAFRFKDVRITSVGKRILSIGLTAGLQNAIFSIGNIFVQASVNSFDTAIVSGNAAATNTDTFVFEVMAAFYVACTSFVAQNYGTFDKKRVIKSYFISLLYSFAIGLVIGLMLLVFSKQVLMLFVNKSEDAEIIEEVVAAGVARLKTLGWAYCFSGAMDCTIAASRGLGKTLVPTIFVIVGACVFRIVWVMTIFKAYHTLTALYLVYFFSWIITALAEVIYFAILYRKIFYQKKDLRL